MFQLEIEDNISVAHELPALIGDHPCSGMHGHEMVVTIKVTGERKPEGWIVPFERLVELWERHCRRHLDHKVLNDVIEHPTCENVAEWIAKALHPVLRDEGVSLAEVAVGELLQSRVRARAIWAPWCELWAAPGGEG